MVVMVRVVAMMVEVSGGGDYGYIVFLLKTELS